MLLWNLYQTNKQIEEGGGIVLNGQYPADSDCQIEELNSDFHIGPFRLNGLFFLFRYYISAIFEKMTYCMEKTELYADGIIDKEYYKSSALPNKLGIALGILFILVSFFK